MANKKRLQWHPAFYGAIRLEHDIPLSEITLSFIRQAKPTKLLKRLKKEKFQIEEKYAGIYYIIKEGFFPIQIIVTKEIDRKNHIWLNSLNDNISQDDVIQFLRKSGNLTDLDDKSSADSVWEILKSQNSLLIKELWEDKDMYIPKMFEDLVQAEIDKGIKTELDKWINNTENMAYNTGIDMKGIQVFQNMIKRGFSRADAQAMAEISDELVERAFAEMKLD